MNATYHCIHLPTLTPRVGIFVIIFAHIMSSTGHDVKILIKFDLCGAGPHHKKLPTGGSGGKGLIMIYGSGKLFFRILF